jgi:hypothetical protein
MGYCLSTETDLPFEVVFALATLKLRSVVRLRTIRGFALLAHNGMHNTDCRFGRCSDARLTSN